MIKKIKNFIEDIVWEFRDLTGKQKAVLYACYAAFMLLFYFIGLPAHKGLLDYVAGFVVLTVLFIVLAYYAWVKILDR